MGIFMRTTSQSPVGVGDGVTVGKGSLVDKLMGKDVDTSKTGKLGNTHQNILTGVNK